ncbi:MAG: UDP-N-acetylmuramoyl-tripeptide--D-alanyl-D-alanine ligase [Syntrophomonadaceae bacterium]
MRTLILNKPVIAITGSSGKTTTKEMLASILRQRWKVFKTKGNKNHIRALKQYARQINKSYQAAVLELGIVTSGQLARMCRIIKPNIAVITMIGTAHIGNFGGSVEKLVKAKSEIIHSMKPTGTLFLNADDRYSQLLNTEGFLGKIITVGINNDADYQAHNIKYVAGGMTFEVRAGSATQEYFIPIYGTHNVYNALFAIAVADHLGISPSAIRAGLKTYTRRIGRLKVFRLKRDVLLIDDSYNANPQSMKAAIDVLSTVGRDKNIAVLGNMSELGQYSQEGHSDVGRHLADKNVHLLFTLGSQARHIGIAASSAGFPEENIIHCSKRSTLHRRLRKEITNGTTILVKGSHSAAMKKTARFLRSQKSLS